METERIQCEVVQFLGTLLMSYDISAGTQYQCKEAGKLQQEADQPAQQ